MTGAWGRRALAALMGGMAATLAMPGWTANVASGAKLYNIHCAGCHGARGVPAMPGLPNFSRGEGMLKTDAELARSIEQGRGVMPAFRGLLTPQEIQDIIAYMYTLR